MPNSIGSNVRQVQPCFGGYLCNSISQAQGVRGLPASAFSGVAATWLGNRTRSVQPASQTEIQRFRFHSYLSPRTWIRTSPVCGEVHAARHTAILGLVAPSPDHSHVTRTVVIPEQSSGRACARKEVRLAHSWEAQIWIVCTAGSLQRLKPRTKGTRLQFASEAAASRST